MTWHSNKVHGSTSALIHLQIISGCVFALALAQQPRKMLLDHKELPSHLWTCVLIIDLILISIFLVGVINILWKSFLFCYMDYLSFGPLAHSPWNIYCLTSRVWSAIPAPRWPAGLLQPPGSLQPPVSSAGYCHALSSSAFSLSDSPMPAFTAWGLLPSPASPETLSQGTPHHDFYKLVPSVWKELSTEIKIKVQSTDPIGFGAYFQSPSLEQ